MTLGTLFHLFYTSIRHLGFWKTKENKIGIQGAIFNEVSSTHLLKTIVSFVRYPLLLFDDNLSWRVLAWCLLGLLESGLVLDCFTRGIAIYHLPTTPDATIAIATPLLVG